MGKVNKNAKKKCKKRENYMFIYLSAIKNEKNICDSPNLF